MTTERRESFATAVAEQLIEQLRAGTAPWQKPWTDVPAAAPYNATTGKAYRGINSLILQMAGRSDPRWLTYRQAQDLGAQVMKGERGITCQKWIFDEERVDRDQAGRPVKDESGQSRKVSARLERPRMMLFTVFNAEQVEGLPKLVNDQPKYAWNPSELAERLMAASGAVIRHSATGGAYYAPSDDYIQLPDKDRFPTAEHYYATATHELGHWTGHESRLNRDLAHPFGSEGYAKEELRAEIASLMLGRTLGIPNDPGAHAAYVDHWVGILQRDHLEVFRAAADAEKILRHLVELVPELQQAYEQGQGAAAPGEDDDMVRSAEAVKPSPGSERFYLQVDRAEKDEAKALGARWDGKRGAWYVPAGVDPAAFTRWWPSPAVTPGAAESGAAALHGAERDYLAVPYSERAAAKAAGAQWDPERRAWYAGPRAELEKLARWRPSETNQMQLPRMTPREEFAAVLKGAGLIVTDDHPIMDGRWHRLKIEGDKPGEFGGTYKGHLDGRPAGFYSNHRSKVEGPWKSLGYVVTDREREALAAENAAKLAARAAQQESDYNKVAERLAMELKTYQPLTAPTPYLELKGVEPAPGIFTNGRGDTIVPAYDVDGKQWGTHYISAEGRKRIASDSRKTGTFHVVGGFGELDGTPVIVIAEGYATAAEARRALDWNPVVAAFDSGNLVPVAKALRERYPDRPILILGDDDSSQIPITGRNPGTAKAREAAQAVNGTVVFPTFLPADVKADPRAWTDFNDLARSALGPEGVARQIRPVFDRLEQNYSRAQEARLVRTKWLGDGAPERRQDRDDRVDEQTVRRPRDESRPARRGPRI